MKLVKEKIYLISVIVTCIWILACSDQGTLHNKAEMIARRLVSTDEDRIVTEIIKSVEDKFQLSFHHEEIKALAVESLNHLEEEYPAVEMSEKTKAAGKPREIKLCSNFGQRETRVSYCLLIKVRLGVFSSAESIYLKSIEYGGKVVILNQRII
jgi:hypothetical protein